MTKTADVTQDHLAHDHDASPEQSATERARSAVERMVMDGTLAPGRHVNESALALQLQASRSVIREVCRALVENGLLVAYPNRGFFVREVSLRDAVELYDIRGALARLAGAQLAARITPEQLDELRALIDQMDIVCAKWDAQAFYDLNNIFHDKIIAFCGNRKLQAVAAGLLKELRIFRHHSIVNDDISASNAQHKAIFQALATRDPVAAANQMEALVQRSRLRFLENMSYDAR
jgi:DNA-binding GntR family transcriptional regulator